MRPTSVVTILLAALLLASVAWAGPGSKAVPLLNGTDRARVLYTFTGARSTGIPNTGVATAVHCSNVDKDISEGGQNAVVGVEFFDLSGETKNSVASGQGVVTILPGGTATITTADTQALVETETLFMVLDQGCGRILSSSTKVICTVQVLDVENQVPQSWVQLPVFKKTKQGGA